MHTRRRAIQIDVVSYLTIPSPSLKILTATTQQPTVSGDIARVGTIPWLQWFSGFEEIPSFLGKAVRVGCGLPLKLPGPCSHPTSKLGYTVLDLEGDDKGVCASCGRCVVALIAWQV